MHVTARQEPFEQEAEQLKRHILEGECRPVEQLQQPVAMVKLHQRRDTRMVEPAIGLGAPVAKLVLAQRIAYDRGHYGKRRSPLPCGEPRPERLPRKLAPAYRHITPADPGQASKCTSIP